MSVKPRTRRTFLYCVQTGGGLSPVFTQILKGRHVLLLSYKESTEKTDIFFPGSTWTTGRNAMVKHINTNKLNYDYYVFCDDDLTFTLESINIFEQSVNDLKNYPIIVPKHWNYAEPDLRGHKTWGCGVYSAKGLQSKVWAYQTVDWFDGACNAFSKEAFDKLLPYETSYDKINWHMSQLMMILKANYFFKNKIVQINKVEIKNPTHSSYPQEIFCFNNVAIEYINNHIGHPFKMSEGFEILPEPEPEPESEVKEDIEEI